MQFSEDLLKQFILALEHTKIPVGGDMALRLQHVFHMLSIHTINDLAKHKFVLGPVVASNPDEQHRFYSAFEHFLEQRGAARLDLKTTASKAVKKTVRRTYVLIISLGFTLALLLAVLALYNPIERWLNPVYAVKFEMSDSLLVENGVVRFENLTDPDHNFTAFEWDFGDGDTRNTDSAAVVHKYNSPGEYMITLTGFNADSAISEYHRVLYVQEDSTRCHVHPAFHYSISDSSWRTYTFYNTSIGECIESWEWSFGDTTMPVKVVGGHLPDSIVHRFDEGWYNVVLSVHAPDTVFMYAETFEVREEEDVIPLAPVAPVRKHDEEPIVLAKSQWELKLFLLVFLLVLPVLMHFILYIVRKRRLNRVFRAAYNHPPTPQAPYVYNVDEYGAGIHNDRKVAELAFRLRQQEMGDSLRLDIPMTLNDTIRNAGYPRLVFNEVTTEPRYVALVDLDSGVSQQVQLFRELLETLEMYRVNFTTFYFRGNVQTCFNDEYPDGISIGKISELYSSSRLILYTRGHSLLNENNHDGLVSWARKIFGRWKHSALITPVPRENWDANEAVLIKLFALYPAGLNGHLVMAKGFIRGRHRLFTRKKITPWLDPFPADLELYQQYTGADKAFYTWLLALSVPEKTDWNITLMTGKVVEDILCKPGERLVTYENLLRLTSVEWLKRGRLTAHHRQELFNELKKQPKAEQVINDINRELQRELERINPPKDSTAELEKKIQLTVLKYQLKGEQKSKDLEHEIHYLSENGLLGTFSRKNIYSTKRGFLHFNYRKALAVAGAGLTLLLLSFSSPVYPNIEQFVYKGSANDTIYDTTAAYLNNLAVDVMNEAPSGSNDSVVIEYLTRALNMAPDDDTIRGNYLVATYRAGLLSYNALDYRTAMWTFGLNQSYFYFLPVDSSAVDTISYRFPQPADGLLKRSLYPESFSEKMALYVIHAEAVSLYYNLHSLGIFDSDTLSRFEMNEMNERLLRHQFYSFYPDSVRNLKHLLETGDQLPRRDSFNLKVEAEPNKGKPLIRIKNFEFKEVARGYSYIEKRLQAGVYYAVVYYDVDEPTVRSIVLNRDQTVTVEPNGELKKYSLNIELFDEAGTPIAASMNFVLTDVVTGETRYDGLATSFRNMPNAYPESDYLLNVTLKDGSYQNEQFHLRSDTTLKIIVRQKPLTIFVQDIFGNPADSVTISHLTDGIVYGTTDAKGYLTFIPGPKFSPAQPLQLTKGKFQQRVYLAQSIMKTGGTQTFKLNDYTGVTLVLLPTVADSAMGEFYTQKRQAEIVEVLRNLYPNDKFVAVPINEDNYNRNSPPEQYRGAASVVECHLTYAPDDEFASFSVYETNKVSQTIQTYSFGFSCSHFVEDCFQQQLTESLSDPSMNPSWLQHIRKK